MRLGIARTDCTFITNRLAELAYFPLFNVVYLVMNEIKKIWHFIENPPRHTALRSPIGMKTFFENQISFLLLYLFRTCDRAIIW